MVGGGGVRKKKGVSFSRNQVVSLYNCEKFMLI